MAEADLLLEVLIVPLDAPAQLGDVDQRGQGGVFGQGRVESQYLLGSASFLGPFDQQPLDRTRRRALMVAMPRTHARGFFTDD